MPNPWSVAHRPFNKPFCVPQTGDRAGGSITIRVRHFLQNAQEVADTFIFTSGKYQKHFR